MMIKKFAAAFAALALTAGAHATAVTVDSSEQATDASVSGTFTTGTAGNGLLEFNLNGFASLDGQNFYEDDFSLAVNGTTVYVGTFNLGGGGANVTYTNTDGATYTQTGSQTLSFIAPVSLAAGSNTFTFSYFSLDDANHAGFQGTGDEGWGVSNVAVVPEPASLALMLAGLGVVGGLARRRRQA